ncbi:pentapeptide repeat-containing protein, partial [Nostoc sp. CALU 1950]|uniref:pentapeptide repeat-containing protein n=1 Tax=Nostoc sp. CALU 1950 TaxID=3104321 RepID=UPI003EB9BEEB
LDDVYIKGGNLFRAILTNAKLHKVFSQEISLEEANLTGVELDDVYIKGGNLFRAILTNAKLHKTFLEEVSLEEANLTGAKLDDVYIKGGNLFRAILTDAKLNHVFLKESIILKANLIRAELNNVHIPGSSSFFEINYGLPKVNSIYKIDVLEAEGYKKIQEVEKILNQVTKENTFKEIHGPQKLTEILQKIEDKVQLLALSSQGLTNLVNLAFQVSLKKEEARYPRFQIYVPTSEFDDFQQLKLGMRFQKPINLSEDEFTLHRISSGIPPKPYGLIVRERESSLWADGIIRIENFNVRSTYLQNIASKHFFGLTLNIEGPGVLNVLYYPLSELVTHLTFRHGRVQLNYDPTLNPVANKTFFSIAEALIGDSKAQPWLVEIIRGVWSYIFNLAVEFGHGGTFVILPPESSQDSKSSWDRIKSLIDIKHETGEPNLGQHILDLYNSNDKIEFRCQQLFDMARVVAQLSTIDGCVVLDRRLRLLGFGGETQNIATDKSELYVELNSNSSHLEPNGKWNMKQFGTRHRSAARLCASVPEIAAFVVSQDGDIREFMPLPNEEKVGVCGPLRPRWISKSIIDLEALKILTNH